MVQPFTQGRLEALVRDPSNSNSLAIPTSAWRDSFFPERMFLSAEIAPGHGPFFDSAIGRTPFVHRDRLERWLREQGGQKVNIQSAIVLRDLLIGLAMDGVMNSSDAEALSRKWQLQPLSQRPKDRSLDPNRLPTWSLAMVVSWIVWRDLSKVREAWDDYRARCWDWFSFSGRVPIDRGKQWYDVHGEELRPLSPISVLSLGLLEALEDDRDGAQKLVSVKTAREDLWRVLAEGSAAATGLDVNGSIVQIPSHEWPHLELAADVGRTDYVVQKSMSLKAAYTNLQVSRLATQAVWPAMGRAASGADPADVSFDLSSPDWRLLEASVWVGSEGRRLSSQQIADEDLEYSGAVILFDKLFRDPRLVATGIGPKRVREAIPQEYWELATLDPALHGQRHFVSFIDNFLEEEGGEMTPFGEDAPRWHGIQLKRDALFAAFPDFAPAAAHTVSGSTSSGSSRRSARKLDATVMAIAAVFPSGIPRGLSDKERLNAINTWLARHGHSTISQSTLDRASQLG